MGSLTSPEYTLRQCTTSDVPSMIPVYRSAFSKDPLSLYTFPSDAITTAEWQRWLTHRFRSNILKPNSRTFAVFHTSTNEMVAFCRWTFPHVFTPEEQAQRELDEKTKEEADRTEGRDTTWPIGANREVCDLKFIPLGESKKRHVSELETYVAELLAVSQSHQRKGLGRMLLDHVLQMADAEERQTYIEATDAGWYVYKKLGFVDVERVEIDLRKWGGPEVGVNRIMIREPKVLQV